jgi:hypothetical protein
VAENRPVFEAVCCEAGWLIVDGEFKSMDYQGCGSGTAVKKTTGHLMLIKNVKKLLSGIMIKNYI